MRTDLQLPRPRNPKLLIRPSFPPPPSFFLLSARVTGSHRGLRNSHFLPSVRLPDGVQPSVVPRALQKGPEEGGLAHQDLVGSDTHRDPLHPPEQAD